MGSIGPTKSTSLRARTASWQSSPLYLNQVLEELAYCPQSAVHYWRDPSQADIFILLSMYAPQANLPGADTEDYYNQLQYTFAKVPVIEILIPVGDWKGHVGAATGAVSDAHSMHLSPEFLWERQLWQHVVRVSK